MNRYFVNIVEITGLGCRIVNLQRRPGFYKDPGYHIASELVKETWIIHRFLIMGTTE